MALTPWLAAGGQFLASRFEQSDVRSLLPVESEVIKFLSFDFAHFPGNCMVENVLTHSKLFASSVQTDDLQDHIIICGFGRVGQVIERGFF